MELQNEVELLHKIQHPNIISFLGCSIDGDSRFIVYELMHNGSVETQLHGKAVISFFDFRLRNKEYTRVLMYFLPLTNCCRTLSWIGINMAYANENRSGCCKVSLFAQLLNLFIVICFLLTNILATVDQRIRVFA